MIGPIAIALTAALSGGPCDELKSVSLPNVTITAAEAVAAAPAVPAHCRIAAVLTPSADSHIEIEVWLPASAQGSGATAVGRA